MTGQGVWERVALSYRGDTRTAENFSLKIFMQSHACAARFG